MRRFFKFQIRVFAVLSYLSLCACVGPTTPFGAIEAWQDSSKKEASPLKPNETFGPRIEFYPDRQVLHGKSEFSVDIIDYFPVKDKPQLTIFYNGIDVTKQFMGEAKRKSSPNGKRVRFTFDDVRLKTLDPNKIEVRYKNFKGKVAEAGYLPPQCSLFENRKIASIRDFDEADTYVELIEEVARDSNFNPSFLVGIVAQESAFDPKAVSWAKAIGLTQITPLAEKEIIQSFEKWPRYPGINSLSYLTLRSKIGVGEIDQQKEWRLDPKKSIQGGAAYIDYLKAYWALPNNRKLVESLPGNKDYNLSEIILASYNSGAYRVKKSIIEREDQWKTHPKLREAIRYVRKVSSYCYHYSKKEEVKYDSET
ncbi:MAG: transglycosylase SLT domain-containing protein [Bdellovibrionales bacterium]|nr:transglycosylase SLT domain-containing protein [Bdellovibrionales bacterium]